MASDTSTDNQTSQFLKHRLQENMAAWNKGKLIFKDVNGLGYPYYLRRNYGFNTRVLKTAAANNE